MSKRTLVHEAVISSPPELLFQALHTPRAIRAWWGATAAIVLARPGGYCVISWGEENDPSYLSAGRITEFNPPHRMVLSEYLYYAKDGNMPADADFVISFEVSPHGDGAVLKIVQDGFPEGSDEFYDQCVQGWADTCNGIKHFLAG